MYRNMRVDDFEYVCPVCKGTGKELWKHYVNGKYIEEYVECEACSGTGKDFFEDEILSFIYDFDKKARY